MTGLEPSVAQASLPPVTSPGEHPPTYYAGNCQFPGFTLVVAAMLVLTQVSLANSKVGVKSDGWGALLRLSECATSSRYFAFHRHYDAAGEARRVSQRGR